MRKIHFLLSILLLLVFSACDQTALKEDLQSDLALKSASTQMMNFVAHLSGDQEVPAVETTATGQAIFRLSKDGMSMHYKVIVANVDNVRMSHIHMAAPGTNGGIVVWLFPSSPPPPAAPIPGTYNGILAEGDFMADDLVGNLAGMSLSALVDTIKAGYTYVNVHTAAYGGGEIRGVIE